MCVAPSIIGSGPAFLPPRALHRSPFPSGLGNPGGPATRGRVPPTVARAIRRSRRRRLKQWPRPRVRAKRQEPPFVALDRSTFSASAPVAGVASSSRQTLDPVVNGGWCARGLAGF